jgi:hypothetical protein
LHFFSPGLEQSAAIVLRPVWILNGLAKSVSVWFIRIRVDDLGWF